MSIIRNNSEFAVEKQCNYRLSRYGSDDALILLDYKRAVQACNEAQWMMMEKATKWLHDNWDNLGEMSKSKATRELKKYLSK